MRALAVLLLFTVFAGCVNTVEPEGFAVRIATDGSTVYVGEVVTFRAQSTDLDVETFDWRFGDEAFAQGPHTTHAFQTPGSQDVLLRATKADGTRAFANTTIEVLASVTPVTPTTPAPPASQPLSDVQLYVREEPRAGGNVTLVLDGPPGMSGAGRLTLWTDAPIDLAFEALPAALTLPVDAAGRYDWPWSADIGPGTFGGTVSFDVWGEPIEFGAPGDEWLRPGVHSSVCTVNFLFHYKWYRFFIGSAAHCVDDLDINEVCQAAPTGRIGRGETLTNHANTESTKDVWVAYHSWITMDRVRESSGSTCSGNDFALLELGPDAQKVMHPAGLFFGGPTALAEAPYGSGTRLFGYGASNLHGNVGVGYPGQEAVNHKEGVALGPNNAGFSQHVYFAVPGVPGDSGGPAYGPGGEALGAASTITLYPTTGSNHYTVIEKALQYMEEHEGWRPELITYDDWSPTGI